MQELKISTGLVTYRLNDASEITINPTDSLFIEKLYTVFDDLDAKQDNYRVQISKAGANKAVFDIAREANKPKIGRYTLPPDTPITLRREVL